MPETRLGRRSIRYPSATRAGYFKGFGFRAPVALFPSFLGLKRGRQEKLPLGILAS